MKSKTIFLFAALVLMLASSCSQNQDGPTVTPPSWKGFNYAVKRSVDGGKPGEYIQEERGDLVPGDSIRIYAVRKSAGTYIGEIRGDVYVRTTIYPENGAPVVTIQDQRVVSLANSEYTGWEDPYATFGLPDIDVAYTYFKVDVACQFSFKAFGNQYSEVNYGDQTSHEDPYIGHIYTDLVNFHPMNGGSANSGKEGDGLKYHTIYQYTK